MTGYLWFPEEAELSLLQAALQLLRPLTPLPFSKSIPKSVAQGGFQSTGERIAYCAMTLQQLQSIHDSNNVVHRASGHPVNQVLLVGSVA